MPSPPSSARPPGGCREQEFDGVEVHAGHHYFLHSFLSPVTNHRTDGYGGSLENRTRILREIVEAIRAACGQDFPLMFRISLEEYIGKDGYHADTGIKICQMLEGWGVDAINVTASGTNSKLSQSVEPMYYPQGWRKHLAKAVKGTVSIPVLSVALIRDPAYAEKLLREGVLDFAGSVRTHLADPNWAAKARAGQEEDILPCISCMACFAKYDQAGHITCAVNPETGYEAQLPPLPQDGAGRLVVVLGSGPAGLEGAWMAARQPRRAAIQAPLQAGRAAAQHHHQAARPVLGQGGQLGLVPRLGVHGAGDVPGLVILGKAGHAGDTGRGVSSSSSPGPWRPSWGRPGGPGRTRRSPAPSRRELFGIGRVPDEGHRQHGDGHRPLHRLGQVPPPALGIVHGLHALG